MRRVLTLLAIGAFALVAGAAAAGAEATGGCTGTINGVDVTNRSSSSPGDAVDVDADQDITVAATSPGNIEHYKIQLEFAGITWTVGKGDGDGASWSKVVNISDYARYGVGLYRVSGVSTGAGACTGSALVKVKGNPLTTVAGLGATAVSAAGIGGVAVSTLRARGRVR
jgi:hypothetical protein